MTRFDWNGLRVGEHVLVHDRGAVGLSAGIVKSVERRPRFNLVGVSSAGASRPVLWPTAGLVHLDRTPVDAPGCWRCRAGAGHAP